MRTAIVSLIILSVVMTASNGTTSIVIRFDGVIGADEWAGAETYRLGKGGKVLMKTEGTLLFVALAGEKKGWAHFYLSDGEKVKVMHVSAALDAVEYEKQGDLWRTSGSFQWEMRGAVYNEEIEGKMEAYCAENGWVANNVNIGDRKTIECKFDLSRWSGKYLSFACVMAEYDMTLHCFPTTLRDHTLLPRLVQGYAPDSLLFEPAGWKLLREAN